MKDREREERCSGADGCDISPPAGRAEVRASAGPAGLDSTELLVDVSKPEPFP